MRLKPAFVFTAALALTPAAFADAIPVPEELSAVQEQLIGVWQEEAPLWPAGLGHSYLFRTIAFGSTEVSMLTYGGIPPANMYATSVLRGEWTARRQGGKTLIITLTQSAERGTVLTLVFDGADSFMLTDAETDRYPASRFRRVTTAVKEIDPFQETP